MSPATPSPSLLVVCLCAEWCGVCRDYRSTFMQLQSQFAQARFLWIDVEDQADLVDPLEVEDFPTVLLAVDGEARFFGTLTPQPQTLQRLIRSQLQDGAAPAVADRAVQQLLARIQAALPALSNTPSNSTELK